MQFLRLHPSEMTEREKLELIRFTKWDIGQERTAAEIIERVLAGYYQMWRVVGENGERVAALLVTRVMRTDKGGRTLYVEALVGKGLSGYPEECGRAILGLAKEGNCVSVTGWVIRPGMIKVLKKVGLPIVAQVFMRKVEDAHAS